MPWKDRSSEHEAVSKGVMFFLAIFIIAVLSALATIDSMTAHGESVNTDTGNIRYHAKRIQEGL